MVGDKKSGKRKLICSSSMESNEVPLINWHRIIARETTSSLPHGRITKKTGRHRKTKKEVLTEILNSPNPNAGQEILIDACSDTEEIDVVTQELIVDPLKLPPKKFAYALPTDIYRKDRQDVNPIERLYTSTEIVTMKLNKIKSTITLGDSI